MLKQIFTSIYYNRANNNFNCMYIVNSEYKNVLQTLLLLNNNFGLIIISQYITSLTE